jgi:hypothetical protein
MPYDIRYQRDAKADLDSALGTYGADFQADMMGWLAQLAKEAEAKEHTLSLDFEQVLGTLEQVASSTTGSWQHSWRRFKGATWATRARAILALVRLRKPPWELRASRHWFHVLGSFNAEVFVYFEVDHVNKRIIVRLFDGLPGQE